MRTISCEAPERNSAADMEHKASPAPDVLVLICMLGAGEGGELWSLVWSGRRQLSLMLQCMHGRTWSVPQVWQGRGWKRASAELLGLNRSIDLEGRASLRESTDTSPYASLLPVVIDIARSCRFPNGDSPHAKFLVAACA